ncbi:hypothetical protein VP01_95g2 [Puccinia sorghi]|uniref:Uncharacterized protein n=1 Tax=Puccinia sorghi TaxID=27349 RepID=A0A0L6U8A7_9BASI|nr:hypothetical protein VP01_95g2 [Puccinia sorghi]
MDRQKIKLLTISEGFGMWESRRNLYCQGECGMMRRRRKRARRRRFICSQAHHSSESPLIAGRRTIMTPETRADATSARCSVPISGWIFHCRLSACAFAGRVFQALAPPSSLYHPLTRSRLAGRDDNGRNDVTFLQFCICFNFHETIAAVSHLNFANKLPGTWVSCLKNSSQTCVSRIDSVRWMLSETVAHAHQPRSGIWKHTVQTCLEIVRIINLSFIFILSLLFQLIITQCLYQAFLHPQLSLSLNLSLIFHVSTTSSLVPSCPSRLNSPCLHHLAAGNFFCGKFISLAIWDLSMPVIYLPLPAVLVFSHLIHLFSFIWYSAVVLYVNFQFFFFFWKFSGRHAIILGHVGLPHITGVILGAKCMQFGNYDAPHNSIEIHRLAGHDRISAGSPLLQKASGAANSQDYPNHH